MRILFLDDDILRQKSIKRLAKKLDIELVQVYNLSEFKSKLAESFDIIFFDHDLGTNDIDFEFGTKAVDFLFEMKYNRDVFCVVHSHNPMGAENIRSKLKSAGFERTIVYPFGSKENWLDNCICESEKGS